MRLKTQKWREILLAGGLLLVLFQGVILIPEIRQGLFPEAIWEEKLLLARKECTKVGEKIIAASVNLDALNNLSKANRPSSEVACGNDFSMAWIKRTFLEFMSHDNSWKKQLYVTRKNLAQAERRLTYLDTFLGNLYLSYRVAQADKAALFANPNVCSSQMQVYSLRQRCQEYRKELENLSHRMENFKEPG